MNANSIKSLKLPKLKCKPSHHAGRGKNERIARWKNWSHQQDVSTKITVGNNQNLFRSGSRNWRWSWIFCSVHTAHAIWAWIGIYGVIWPFEFKSFRIAVRPHIHHVSLEALPSAKKEEIQKSQCLFLYTIMCILNNQTCSDSSPLQFFIRSF